MTKRSVIAPMFLLLACVVSACAGGQPRSYDDEPTFQQPAAPNLSDAGEFVAYVQEHNTLPGDYTAAKLASLADAFGVDMTADKLAAVGEKYCSSPQTKKYLTAINRQFADVDALRDSGDDYIAQALGGVDLRALDEESAEFIDLTGVDAAVMDDLTERRGVALYGLLDLAAMGDPESGCADEFDDTQLRGAHTLIAFGSGERDFQPLLD